MRRQQPYELLDAMREKLLAALPQVVAGMRVPAEVPLARVAKHPEQEIRRRAKAGGSSIKTLHGAGWGV